MNPHAQKHPFTSAALEVLQAASPPDVVAVLDEAVLHRLVGSPQAMHDALVHVAEMSQRPYIAVQVAPAGNGANAGLAGAFDIAAAGASPATAVTAAVTAWRSQPACPASSPSVTPRTLTAPS